MLTIQKLADTIIGHCTLMSLRIKEHLNDEDGIGVIEVILILLVLVGLVLIFKDKIRELANNIFSNINTQAEGV